LLWEGWFVKEEILQIKRIYSELVPRFGINHAKVFFSLLDSRPQEARELIENTGIPREKIYSVLKELAGFGLVKQAGSAPMRFFIESPREILRKKIAKREKELESKLCELEKIQCDRSSEKPRAYVLDVEKTKIFGLKSKNSVDDVEELRAIRRAVDEAINRKCRVLCAG